MISETNAPERIHGIISGLPWRWASTYTKTWPHQYAVRDRLSPASRDRFDELVAFWREHSIQDWFWNTQVWYLTIGPNVYWADMKTATPNIMNRCEVEESYPWLSEHGLIKERLEARKNGTERTSGER